MKKIISLLTTGIIFTGMCPSAVCAESEYPTKDTLVLNTFDEVRDYFTLEDTDIDYKIDFIEEEDSCTMIVYGLKDVQDISDMIREYKNNNGGALSSYPEYHSGISMGYSNENHWLRYNDISHFYFYFFVDNTLTDFLQNDISPLEAASQYKRFDVIPYVYPELISGDADCDGKITSADASEVLSAYSMLSTGKKLTLNSTIFDYNNDGRVDSNDASAILAKYAELSTTRNN
ncbi:MAG: hypothetical protein K2I00_08660 [Ruminococcus sp.]|nr:hypothetical protein [Ruminococcus sp.]